MKLKHILAFVVTSLILATSCTEQELLDHSEINVSQSIVGIPFEGGISDITLKTTADWTIINPELVELEDAEGEGTGEYGNDSIPEWLTISKTSGTANPDGDKITFTAEEASADREVTLNIVANGKVQYLIVKQTSTSGEVVVTPIAEILSNGVDGKVYYVRGILKAIDSDVYGNLQVEDETGIIKTYGCSDKNGVRVDKGLGFASLGIGIGDEILISGPWTGGYGNLQQVTVYQDETKKSLLTATPTEIEFESKEAGEIQFEVMCKEGNLNIETRQDWLSMSGMAPLGDNKYTLTFSAGANTDVQTRKDTITLSIKGNDAVAPVRIAVSQVGEEPPLSTIEDAIAAPAGTMVRIEGMIMTNGKDAYVVKDGTGFMLIYKGTYTEEARPGHVMKIVGEMGAYNHAPQIKEPLVEEYLRKESYDHGDPIVFDAATADAFCAGLSEVDKNNINMKIQYIELTGKLSVGNYTNLYIEGAETAQGSIYSISDYQMGKLEPLNDKNVILKGYLVQLSGGRYLNTIMSSVEEATAE